jgi:hypothetical protein
MRPEAFVVWFSGYLEACGGALSTEQVDVVKEKMQQVMLPGFLRGRRMPPVEAAPQQ